MQLASLICLCCLSACWIVTDSSWHRISGCVNANSHSLYCQVCSALKVSGSSACDSLLHMWHIIFRWPIWILDFRRVYSYLLRNESENLLSKKYFAQIQISIIKVWLFRGHKHEKNTLFKSREILKYIMVHVVKTNIIVVRFWEFYNPWPLLLHQLIGHIIRWVPLLANNKGCSPHLKAYKLSLEALCCWSTLYPQSIAHPVGQLDTAGSLCVFHKLCAEVSNGFSSFRFVSRCRQRLN